jgi:hypothetical protein
MNPNFSKLISIMTETELREANSIITDMLKAKRSVASVSIKSQLHTGMTVGIDHPSNVGQLFEIIKINRTRVNVKPLEGFGAGYSVPFTMLILDVDAKSATKPTLKPSYVYLSAWLEEFHNHMRRVLNQSLIEIPTNEENAKEVINMLNTAISPENISCDGELNRTEINRRTRLILGAVKDLEQILGRKIELEDY